MNSAKKNLLISFLINAAFLFFVLIVFTPYYDTNDDFIISGFVDGSMGFSEPRIIYPNVILGWILKCSYTLLPAVPWYAIMQYALIFCTFTAAVWVIFEREDTITALALAFVTLFVFALDAYVCIQFTKTAAASTLGGLFLLFYSADLAQNRRTSALEACGIILVLFGAMYRPDAFRLCGAISCFIILEPLLGNAKNAGTDFAAKLKAAWKTCSPFVLLLSLVLALKLIDSLAYRAEAWDYYLQYNEVRRSIMDYQLPQYAPYAEEFDRLGIPESFITIMRRWELFDPKLLDLETIKAVAEIPPEIKLIGGDTAVMDFFPVCGKVFITGWCFAGLVIYGFAWLLMGRRSLSAVVSIACAGFTALLISVYLFLSGRYNLYRVNYCIVMALAFVMLWFIPEGKLLLSKTKRACLAGVVALFSVLLLYKYAAYNNGQNMEKFFPKPACSNEVSEKMEWLADDEHFVIYNSELPYQWFGTPFAPKNMNLFSHAACLGGWQTNHPAVLAMYEKHSIENPFHDMVNNDSVYLLCDNAEEVCAYIRDEYYPDAKLNLVCKIDERFGVYTVTSGGEG